MKLRRPNLALQYNDLQSHGRRHLRARPYLLPIFGLILGAVIVVVVALTYQGKSLQPSSSHVVFLFDQGKRQTLDTRAATVGELVKRLPLNLQTQDVVEPTADTPIVEDNFRINVYRARPVTVMDGASRTITVTAQRSPRVVAQQASVSLYPEDNVSFAPGSIKENIIGEKVVINRATPVFLNLYGTPLTVRTHVKTVADLLKEKQVKLAKDDTLQPSPNTPISANLQVFVIRNGIQIQTVDEVVAPPTQIVQDASLSFGTSVVRQKGTPGKKTTTYQIQTQNGNVVSRTVIQSVVVQEPVPTIIARGNTIDISGNKTALMASAGISSGDYGYVNYIISRESNWRLDARNASGCLGLGQRCPGSILMSACPNWQVDGVCQLHHFTGYAGRYGGWGGAYNFWISHGYW